jgi:uncharacterized protein (DUF2236 family)
MWVHATLVDTALTAYQLVVSRVTKETRERYFADCRLIGALFGIPMEVQPPSWAGFQSYVETTIASDQLAVGATGREIATRVLSGAGRVPVPRWYRDVTTALIPERLRAEFALPFGEEEARRAERALRMIRASLAVASEPPTTGGAVPGSSRTSLRPKST